MSVRVPVATHIFPVQITWFPPPDISLAAAVGPAMSYEKTLIGVPFTSSVTGPIQDIPSYEYAVEKRTPRPTATHIWPFHATSRASTENTDFPVIPVHVMPPSSENASEFVRPFPAATHFSPFHATAFAPRDPPTPNDVVPAAISAGDENIAFVAPPGTICHVAPSSSEYEIVPVTAGAGVNDDRARTSTAPPLPPPPPTASIRFAGNVTLLSRRATLTGEVNAFVVMPMTLYASPVNAPVLLWTPTHVAGTGGVAVE